MTVGDKKKIVRKICCKDELYQKKTKSATVAKYNINLCSKINKKKNKAIFYVLDEEQTFLQ